MPVPHATSSTAWPGATPATGWLAGLRDCSVGRALACLHERPEDDWTLEKLAKAVGLSRSALAERFAHFVGDPPMQYLTRWRMQVAARLLADGQAKVSTVALQVGYDSVAAFSRRVQEGDRRPAGGLAQPVREAAVSDPSPD
jgi:AraC-like DNA-binding protein